MTAIVKQITIRINFCEQNNVYVIRWIPIFFFWSFRKASEQGQQAIETETYTQREKDRCFVRLGVY